MKVALVLFALLSCTFFISISGKPPILIVPGIMGSQLKAKVTTLNCHTGWKYKPYWFQLHRILCLHKLKMRFKKGKFKNAKKVRVKVYEKSSHFGRTTPVECIYKSLRGCEYPYLKSFVKYFAEKGYKKERDITAAAYDWRLSPFELKGQGYFGQVKTLIETMFDKNGQKRVTIVAHSYGGLLMVYFLRNEVEQKWKKKYIKAFIPLGSPFGGATKIVGALAYGKMPIELILPSLTTMLNDYLRPVIRTFPSLYFLAPRPDVFQDKVLVEKGTSSYTAKHFKNILTYRYGFDRYQATQDNNKDYSPGNPGVPTYCMYGTGRTTPDSYEVKKSGKLKKTNTVKRGDGTVDRVSLDECRKWSTKVTTFPGVNHQGVLKDKAVLNAISDIVLS